MQNPKVDLRPPRAAKPLQLMWALWAILAASLLTISAWGFALHYPVHPVRRIAGIFESQSQSVAAIVPAGVRIAEVLVADGDTVTKGQTLARFDQLALHKATHKLRETLAANTALQTCWRSRPQSTTEWQTASVDPAIAVCENQLRQDALVQAQLLHRRDSLKRETALAVQELLSRAQNAEDSVRRILTLRAGMEREALHSMIRDIEFELALLMQRQQAERLDTLAVLQADATVLSRQLLTLEALDNAPWLYAPKSGRIERVRVPKAHMLPSHDEVLAHIRLAPEDAQTASIAVTHAEAAMLSPGDTLMVTFSGLPLSFPPSQALVSNVTTGTAEGKRTAIVEIQFDSTSPLPEPLDQLPQGTRSALLVRMPQTRLAPILQAASQRVFSSF